MENKKINLSYLSDPLSSKAWSGTPNNIIQILNKEKLVGEIYITGSIGRLRSFFLKTISIIYYQCKLGLKRGRFYRKYTEKKCLTKSQNSEAPVLHFSTLDMPLSKTNKKDHFLFCDSSWNIYIKHSRQLTDYSKHVLLDADKYEKKSLETAKHIFTTSQYLKMNLIEHYKISDDKITVVGTGRGIIEPYFGEKVYSNGKILFVAKDRFYDKGGPLVLQAFKIASEKNTNLRLIIVGQDEYLKNIKDENIEVYGFVERHILQELFISSALFLLPAHYEPWGLVYFEALSCKVPIVGINKNSFPELSGNGKFGFGLDNENPKLLAETILYAFENPDILKMMGLAGQKYCLNNFSWENTTKKIIEGIQKYYS